jgi:hypothetical protein
MPIRATANTCLTGFAWRDCVNDEVASMVARAGILRPDLQ